MSNVKFARLILGSAFLYFANGLKAQELNQFDFERIEDNSFLIE